MIESEGRDLATAARLNLLDRAALERALTDPSLLFGSAPANPAVDVPQDESLSEATPDTSPPELAGAPSVSEADSGPPREPEAPPEDASGAVTPSRDAPAPGTAGPPIPAADGPSPGTPAPDQPGPENPLPDASATDLPAPNAPTPDVLPDDIVPPSTGATLELPEALREYVDVPAIESAIDRTVRFGPDLTSRRATALRGRPSPPNGSLLTRAERLERAASGAAFLAVLAVAPVLVLARESALLALVLLVAIHLVVAEVAPRIPHRLGPEAGGATVGTIVGLAMLIPLALFPGGLRLPMALAVPLAGALLGAWAAWAIDDPVVVARATARLRWTLAGSVAADLAGLLLAQWRNG